MVIDIQAPPSEQSARLRIWAIETVKDSDNNERFNNIQLTYSLDYGKARKFIERAETITREDLSMLAHDSSNYLKDIFISDLTGKDSTTGQILGKKYEVETDTLRVMTEDLSSELMARMTIVLERLKKTASSK